MNAYYSISFNNAKNFLKSLPDTTLNDLYDLYNVGTKPEDYETDSTELIHDVEALASIISDNDLYKLGYVDGASYCENGCTSDTEESCCTYNYSLQDVITFLNSLDEDTLYDLLHKYCAIDAEDLAVGITDAELVSLGFDKLTETDDVSLSSPISDDNCDKVFSSNDFDNFAYDANIQDKYDFFEDVDYSIPILVIDPDNLIFGVHGDYYYNSLKSQLDPYLVSSCDKIDFDNCGDGPCNDLVLFKIVPVEYPEQIQEKVVINGELNPALFDNETQLLKPDVLKQLQDYLSAFEAKMAEKSIDVDYSDINLIGSNAGYLYTPESDIDIHYIWSYPMDKDNFDQMRAEFVDYMTENPLTINGYNVELNLEDGMNMEATTKRRYSLVNNDWVNGSNAEEVYTADDINKVEGYEAVVDSYAKRIDDVIKNDSYAEAVKLKQEIRTNRSEDLATVGSLSMGNVVFKELRNSGKFGELREFIKSKELALAEPTSEK